jgi:hypothetical protein
LDWHGSFQLLLRIRTKLQCRQHPRCGIRIEINVVVLCCCCCPDCWEIITVHCRCERSSDCGGSSLQRGSRSFSCRQTTGNGGCVSKLSAAAIAVSDHLWQAGAARPP